jgi:type I restriction enzyme S subunit
MNTETQNPATTPKPQNTNHLSEWKKVKLGDFIEVKHGFAFKGKNIIDEKTENILVTPGNFHIGGGFKTTKFKYYNGTFPEEYILNEGDIIVTMTDLSQETNTLGYSAKVPKYPGVNFLHNQRIGLIEFKSQNADKEFIYWLLRTDDYHGFIVGSASGTSIMHTSPSRIKEYSFLLPPLPEQQAIAEVLSSLDDKIDLLHRQNKTLEALAETLFRQWFIEEADERWEEKGLDEIAEFMNGLACQKFPRKPEEIGLPVIKIKEMRNGITENSDWATADVPQKYIIQDGDLLFSWSGSLDVVLWFGGKGVLNQHLFKVTSDDFPQWFYYFWIKHHLEYFKSIADDKATTMGHIQRNHLSDAKVLVPPKKELQEMNENIDPLFQKIKSNSQQILTLTVLRDTLLPKLMSGEVRVDF